MSTQQSTAKQGRKRTREDAFDEQLIDDALKGIYENDEVENPTKKKIRRRLQHNLNVSRQFIKKHKKTIHVLMSKYWISPPKSGDDQTSSLPDHVMQRIFPFIFPAELFKSMSLVCRWWRHLLHKESTLRTLCTGNLQLTTLPNRLEVQSVIPWIKKSCRRCATAHTLDDTLDLNAFKELKEFKETVCWITPLCSRCFESDTNLQGIYWISARTRYELTDRDLYCCRIRDMGYKYVNHFDLMEVAKDKYGDLCHIKTLSALQNAKINRARKKAYDVKCAELRAELTLFVRQMEDGSNGALSADEVKEETENFLNKHHNGYDFFAGAHDPDIASNFHRKMLQYTRSLSDIKQMFQEHIDAAGKRKQDIRSMTRKDYQSEIYETSWMSGRFGGEYC